MRLIGRKEVNDYPRADRGGGIQIKAENGMQHGCRIGCGAHGATTCTVNLIFDLPARLSPKEKAADKSNIDFRTTPRACVKLESEPQPALPRLATKAPSMLSQGYSLLP